MVKGRIMHLGERESVCEAYERTGELKQRLINAKTLAAIQGEESRRRYRRIEAELDAKANAAHRRIGELHTAGADDVQKQLDDVLGRLEETCDRVADYIQVRLLR
jgi:hypothetical protein